MASMVKGVLKYVEAEDGFYLRFLGNSRRPDKLLKNGQRFLIYDADKRQWTPSGLKRRNDSWQLIGYPPVSLDKIDGLQVQILK